MARITIGSLVRHRVFGELGIVIEHAMYDGEWGGFRVKFNRPVNKGAANNLKTLFDRADRWQLVSGSDNQ
tara:strand:+ start:1419 stop:1628 length:210 start_codon:yes stop_codon:yes gene_type:complete